MSFAISERDALITSLHFEDGLAYSEIASAIAGTTGAIGAERIRLICRDNAPVVTLTAVDALRALRSSGVDVAVNVVPATTARAVPNNSARPRLDCTIDDVLAWVRALPESTPNVHISEGPVPKRLRTAGYRAAQGIGADYRESNLCGLVWAAIQDRRSYSAVARD